MKQSFRFKSILRTVLLASFLTSCAPPKDSHKYQIPWRSEDGRYSLQTVTIDSLSDPDTLSSPLVKLFVTPSEENGKLTAPSAIGRFMKRSDGVNVPLDFVSLQGATIHANFERIHEFDKAAGADTLVTWPLEVSVETEVETTGDSTNNAFFDGNRNAILILPYTDNSRKGLPISLNGGVLAHEHFHSLFFQLVLKKLIRGGHNVDTDLPEINIDMPTILSEINDVEKVGTEEMRRSTREFNEFLLRGLNEGLADFWSWLAIGDDDFVGRSISAYRECRRLDKGFTALPSSTDLHMRVFSARVSSGQTRQFRGWMAYQVGVQYARFFKEFAIATYGEKPSFKDRVEMAQSIIRALGGDFANQAAQEFSTQDIAADKIVDSVVRTMAEARVNEKSCAVIAEFKESGAKLPEVCGKFNLKKEEIDKQKDERVKKAPPLEYCSCEVDGHNVCH